MDFITRKTFGKDGAEVLIHNSGRKWLNELHIEEKLGHGNLPVTRRKYPSKYRKQIQGLANCNNFQPCRKFLHIKLAIKVIMDCRTTESCKFKRKLRFKLYDVVNTVHLKENVCKFNT